MGGDGDRHHPGDGQDQSCFMFRKLRLKLRDIGFRRDTARDTGPDGFRDRSC